MPRTVIIGAGSHFGARLSTDILAHPELREGAIALVDIDPEHLRCAEAYVRKVVELHGAPVTVEASTDRRALLEGADFVIVSVAVGGPAYSGVPYYREIAIPRRYGVSQQVGDTIGPGGLFRAFRTAPTMLAICRDLEELCPRALVLNYTNPMAILCWAMTEATRARCVGLCHSVQHTSRQLAEYIGKPFEETSSQVAGINHMAWFLEFRWRGEDAYPLLRAAMENPEVLARDRVRFELFRHFDTFVTESSPHLSEYVPYFRKRPELLEPMGLQHRDPEERPAAAGHWRPGSRLRRQLEGLEPIDLAGSPEYASSIVQAVWTGAPARINANVPNAGCITNLPAGCCVEVPCLVDAGGVQPCAVGALPPQLAALNLSNVVSQDLAVQAILEQDARKAYHALLLDPLTAAVCAPWEIRAMFDDLAEAEAEWTPWLR